MLNALCLFAVVSSTLSLVLSFMALARANRSNRSLRELDEKIVRSVMEEGEEASVEAILQTVKRLMSMNDGTLLTTEALKQAREMHKR